MSNYHALTRTLLNHTTANSHPNNVKKTQGRQQGQGGAEPPLLPKRHSMNKDEEDIKDSIQNLYGEPTIYED